jgi:3D (Asp-Asp-Asp) domain-containing protein
MDQIPGKAFLLVGLPALLALVAGLGAVAFDPAGAGGAAGETAVVAVVPGTQAVPDAVAPVLPTEEGEPLVFHEIMVTGYASAATETDSSPSVTASMTRVRPGCLALSRDLLRTFTRNAPFDFGDWVVLPGVGVFIVEDTMHERWERRGDIWFPSRSDALRWGRRRVYVGRLAHPSDDVANLFAVDPATSVLARSFRFGQ